MIKGIIFDLDGTLVNSIEDISDSMNRALTKYNLETHDVQFYTDHIGQGLYKLTEDSTKMQDVDNVYAELLSDYAENYLNKTAPYPEIEALLTQLYADGLKLGVNSNKTDAYTKAIVDKLFIVPFVKVIGDRKNVAKKPDPTSANEIMSAMNLKADEVIYIGDTDHDIKTAFNADLKSIGVTWGYRSEAQLKAAGATYIAHSVMEIYEIIQTINKSI